ncbi:MAG TPA: DUF6678 family protein [Roseiarcus sp.]
MLNPAMNNTKWNELRLEMYGIAPPPSWSTLSLNGYRSPPDREWFYHFRNGGYESILHLDIRVDTPAQRELVHSALKKVHVPGEEMPDGFRVFGYLQNGQGAAFL